MNMVLNAQAILWQGMTGTSIIPALKTITPTVIGKARAEIEGNWFWRS
jgi:hypothetical protein